MGLSVVADSSSDSSPSSSSSSSSPSSVGAPNAFVDEFPPNGATECEALAKLDKPPPSGLGPPKPPPPKALPSLEPPNPPKPEEPSPPNPDEALVAKGEGPPKPAADPNAPVLGGGGANDPKALDALAGLLPSAEKGDFSELAKVERPDDANADVEVGDCPADWSRGCAVGASGTREDFDVENAANGEVVAVFAKPELGFTWARKLVSTRS